MTNSLFSQPVGKRLFKKLQRERRRPQPGYGSPSGQRVPPGSRLSSSFRPPSVRSGYRAGEPQKRSQKRVPLLKQCGRSSPASETQLGEATELLREPTKVSPPSLPTIWEATTSSQDILPSCLLSSCVNFAEET